MTRAADDFEYINRKLRQLCGEGPADADPETRQEPRAKAADRTDPFAFDVVLLGDAD